MKIEVGKKYELNNGEVHECTHMRYDDPLHVSRLGYGPFVINDILYHQDGRFADDDADHEYSVKREWTEHETGTLAELDVKPGDVVELVRGITDMNDGHTYTIQQDGKVLDNDGSGQYYGFVDDICDGVTFRIISRASDKPKTSDKSWPHNGEWSNWFMSGVDGTIKNSLMRGKECEVETQKLAGCKQFAYRFRIKPQPQRETVTLHWGLTEDASVYHSPSDTHYITFTTTDGKPDLDSIKMEEV